MQVPIKPVQKACGINVDFEESRVMTHNENVNMNVFYGTFPPFHLKIDERLRFEQEMVKGTKLQKKPLSSDAILRVQ